MAIIIIIFNRNGEKIPRLLFQSAWGTEKDLVSTTNKQTEMEGRY